MTKIFDRHDRVVAMDSKYTGEEPSWTDSDKLDGVGYFKRRSSALGFYNYYCSTKDLMNDVVKFAKANGYSSKVIQSVKSNHALFSFTASKLARMLNKGMPPTHDGWKEYCEKYPGSVMTKANDDASFVKNEIDRINKAYAEKTMEKSEEDQPKFSVVDRMNNKVNDKVIYMLDGMIDEWAETSDMVGGIDLMLLLKTHEIPVRGLPIVENWLNAYRNSLQNCIDKDNEFDIEGWSNLTKPAIKNRLKEIDKMLLQIEKYRGANAKVRKPRKKKVKSAEVQVKNMKFKESDDKFGVSSVSPTTVPGSQKVYVFNTKTRKLFIYIANSADGIGVKGSTLQNFDEALSYGLTLRKPDDIIPILTTKSDKQIQKAIESLITKQVVAKGRINADCVILRTI